MTDKLRFTRAQIRTAAIIAKNEGVSIRFDADGSFSVSPSINDNAAEKEIAKKPLVRF